jgi:hypothetical protein
LKHRAFLKNGLVCLFSIVSCLWIAETISRYLPRHAFPDVHARRTVVFRPELGLLTNAPYSTQTLSNRWVFNTLAYNRYGFRGPDWTLDGRESRLRIAVLGDSYIEGREVSFDQLATTVLERLLGQGVTVMNFGLAGSSQAEQILLYRNLVRRFRPEIVIHCVTVSNDFEDNVADLSPQRNKNFLELRGDQLIVTPPPALITCICSSPVQGLTDWFTNLGLFRLIFHRLACHTHRGKGLSASLTEAFAASTAGPQNRLLAFDTAPYDHAKNVMKKALTTLGDLCHQDGARFVMISPSHCWSFLAREDPNLDRMREHMERRYAWLAHFAHERCWEYHDLDKAMCASSQDQGMKASDIHIPWDGHWTPAGHRLAAQAIFVRLRDLQGLARECQPRYHTRRNDSNKHLAKSHAPERTRPFDVQEAQQARISMALSSLARMR